MGEVSALMIDHLAAVSSFSTTNIQMEPIEILTHRAVFRSDVELFEVVQDLRWSILSL